RQTGKKRGEDGENKGCESHGWDSGGFAGRCRAGSRGLWVG
ncbi:MAG: hypothetical protein RLZ97_502, partial [Verrucomicrobiota bacterium]